MTARPTCPEPERLGRLLEHDVEADDLAELTAHLDCCKRCQGMLEGLAMAGQPLTALRIAAEGKGQPTERPRTDAINQTLAWLEPSDDPGALGHIDGYKILGVLGQGGMGVVYKAFDPTLHRNVAIKVLAPQMGTSAAARRRFEREARAAAAVNHEHVIAIHAVRERQGLPYLVMECIPGLSLQDVIEHEGPIELRRLLRIGIQIASGLAAAHAQGLVHRDIKPANILLENGIERVKITDFGLARAVDDVGITQSGTVAGTPQYMAPEQAGGEPLDHRADLFSLGSVLYAMCAGQPPFQGDTPLAVIRRVSDREPRPLAELNPDVPDWLAEIVARLHAKRPDNRIQTAAEVADLLEQHLAYLQHPKHAPKPKPLQPMKPPPWDTELGTPYPLRRRSRKQIGIALAATALIAATALFLAPTRAWAQVADYLTTVFRMKTPYGTLAVEVKDPQVKVRVDGEELLIEQPGMNEFRIKPGTYQLTATKDGHLLRQEWITITREGKALATVAMEPAADLVEKPTTAATLRSEQYAETEKLYSKLVERLNQPGQAANSPQSNNSTYYYHYLNKYHPQYQEQQPQASPAPEKKPDQAGTDNRDRSAVDDQIGAALKILEDLRRSMCALGWRRTTDALSNPAKEGQRQDLMKSCAACHEIPKRDSQESPFGLDRIGPATRPAAPKGNPNVPSAGNNLRQTDPFLDDSAPKGAGATRPAQSGTRTENPLQSSQRPGGLRANDPLRDVPAGRPPVAGLPQNNPVLDNPESENANTLPPAVPRAQPRANEPVLPKEADQLPTLFDPSIRKPLDLRRENRKASLDAMISSLAPGPQGRSLLVGLLDGRIAEVEPETGLVTWRKVAIDSDAAHYAFTVAPDDKSLAIATAKPRAGGTEWGSGKISIWDLELGKLVHTLDLGDFMPLTVAISPDGKRLAVGSTSGAVKLWDYPSCQESTTIWHDHLQALPTNTDANALVFSDSQEAGTKPKKLATRTFKVTDRQHVSGLAFTPDNKALITAGKNGQVQLWDLASKEQIRGADVLPQGLDSITISPDGSRLVVIGSAPSGPGTIILLETNSLQPLDKKVIDGASFLGVRFSPDGTGLVTIGGRGTNFEIESGLLMMWEIRQNHMRKISENTSPNNQITSIAFLTDRTFYISTWPMRAFKGFVAGESCDIYRVSWPEAVPPAPPER